MSITISAEGAKTNGLTLQEAIVLLSVKLDVNYQKTLNKLKLEGLVIEKKDIYFNYIGETLSTKGEEVALNIVLDSEKEKKPEECLDNIATQLKEIFPKGKKPGTNFYWAEGVALIKKRLQLFFKKYGKNYTEEQIIGAAKRYIEDQNGDYKYTKLLKYFILKDKIGAAGDVESESTLINYIENEGQSNMSDEWTSELK